jgi:hypothetical protein
VSSLLLGLATGACACHPPMKRLSEKWSSGFLSSVPLPVGVGVGESVYEAVAAADVPSCWCCCPTVCVVGVDVPAADGEGDGEAEAAAVAVACTARAPPPPRSPVLRPSPPRSSMSMKVCNCSLSMFSLQRGAAPHPVRPAVRTTTAAGDTHPPFAINSRNCLATSASSASSSASRVCCCRASSARAVAWPGLIVDAFASVVAFSARA